MDEYQHDGAGSQGYNAYTYAFNNPLKYTDPDGEDPVHIGAALAGGIYNVATNWSKIKGWKSGLAYFGVGAVSGLMASSGNLGGARAIMVGGNAIIHAATGNLPQIDFKNAPGQSLLNLGMYGLEAGLNAYGIQGVATLGGTLATRISTEWTTSFAFHGARTHVSVAATETAEAYFQSNLPEIVLSATKTVSSSSINAAVGSTFSSVSKVGANLNSNSAVSNFGIYEILKDGQLYKFGKADLTRTTQSTGLPTRLHQQLRILGQKFPNSTWSGEVIENLGQKTTGYAKYIENNYIGQFFDQTGSVPLGNVRSFNLLKWLGM